MKPVSYTMLLLSFFTQSTTDSVYLRVPRILVEPIHGIPHSCGKRKFVAAHKSGTLRSALLAKHQNSGHDCQFPDHLAGSSARRFGGL